MRIVYCGPISLRLISDLVVDGGELPDGYLYPLGANLVRGYHNLGHHVSVVTSVRSRKFGRKTRMWVGKNIDITVTPRRLYPIYALDCYRIERRMMMTAIRKAQADVVHAQWCYEFAEAAIDSGVPSLVTIRDDPKVISHMVGGWYRFFRRIYASRVLRKVKYFSAVSPYIAESVRENFHINGQIYITPNGLPVNLFVDRSNSTSHDRIIAITGWDSRKNPKLLIESFALAKKQRPSLTLDLIGEGCGLGGEAMNWAMCHGFNQGINFRGKISYPDIFIALKESSIFLHTTLEESFCMTILEASAMGIPVIALHNSGAIPWLLDGGQAGILVANNSLEICESILKLSNDSGLYAHYSAAALSNAKKRFLLEEIVGQYVDLMTKIVGNEFSIYT